MMLAETVLVTWAWELTAYGTKNTPVSATALHGQPKRDSCVQRVTAFYLMKCHWFYLDLVTVMMQTLREDAAKKAA